MNRRNSCQETLSEVGKKKEGPKRTNSASDAILHPEKGSSLTKSPLLSVVEDKPSKEDIETFSDDDDDVFTRLYKDYRKDVEPKSRLTSNKYLGPYDDEKENLISGRSPTPSGEKSTVDIKSPVCPRRQSAHKTMSEQTVKLPNQASNNHTGDVPEEIVSCHGDKLNSIHAETSNISKQMKTHEPFRAANDLGCSKTPMRQD